jgi:regulator of sirC expression with transglutaminase-like and TPR domain
MSSRPDLALFAHFVGRAEGDIDLAQAALLLAEPEYPGLDIPRYLGVLDDLGVQARRAIGDEDGLEAMRRLLELLYENLGFHGNDDDYKDPRNSFLNEVLERRMGIPITLAIVVIETAHRAGLAAQGVSFPTHFLVRLPVEGGLIVVDPFVGRLLDGDDLRELAAKAIGTGPRPPEAQLLAPASKLQILFRMLNNLRSIYAELKDANRLRGVIERMSILEPGDAELRRQLFVLGGATPPGPTRGPTGVN